MTRWQLDVTYRGIPFFVDATDDELARRGAHHQYPMRDKGTWDDLGKDDTIYSLSGYVTELSPEGYAAARDKLIVACTAGGLGDLVHPYFGTKKLQCTNCRVTHTDKENGVARFALTFIEADEPAAPAEVDDTAAKINSSADAAQDAALDDFADNWNLTGVPGYVYDAATELIQSTASMFTELAEPLLGVMEDTSKFASGTAKLLGVGLEALDNPKAFFMRQVNDLSGSLLNNGQVLGKQIAGLDRMLSLLASKEKDSYKTQQKFMNTGKDWPTVSTYTANRKMQAGNQEALQDLMHRTAVIEAARMTPYMPLESREGAVAVRDTLTGQLDSLAEKAPDTLYRKLESLRTVIVADITKRGPELGRVGSYTPKTTLPALVVAYEIYKDIGQEASRATEIAARNQIHHPGFVPGAQSLEVKLDV